MEQANNTPGINLFDGVNPTLTSPYSPFTLPFYQTQETLIDIDLYEKFITNAVKQFRGTQVYKHYKGFLMANGLDVSQTHSNITAEMVDNKLEMHHNGITIFDIAVIITEHMIKTCGYITSFDLIHELRLVHTRHQVLLVMLDLTSHQVYHNTDKVFIHPDMCVNKEGWMNFLKEYKLGITPEIAKKLITYLDTAINSGESTDGDLSQVRDTIKDWSDLNDSTISNRLY